MQGIITITTDFGDVYPGIMKGVIACVSGHVRTIDITNAIAPGDIRQGAFTRGTVHLAVVDPGVGSSRRALVILGEKYWFVGPDNGLLLPAARSQGQFRAYEITDLRFYEKAVSPVFHGKDVFAPAAAMIAAGESVPGLEEIFDPVDLDFGVPILEEDGIHGQVIFADQFGNVITNIGGSALEGLLALGDTVEINGTEATYATTYQEGAAGDLLLLTGSHGMAEIAVNGDRASEYCGLGAGDEIVIGLKERQPDGR
jgi:S-adenosylmethionine hydrolase